MTLKDFTKQTLELTDDYEGKVIASLIRSNNNQKAKPSILYIHGFNDYFFHPHIAEQLHQSGFNLYALDLRKYGRSLLPNQHPNYCRDISEYYEEITLALEIIKKDNDNEITLLGHSTGGLIGCMYANYGPNKNLLDRLVLNSPFFDFNVPELEKKVSLMLAKLASAIYPYANKRKPLSKLYNQSLLSHYYGEWSFNEDWKPLRGFPAYFQWIVAIHSAQETIRSESNIKVPILVLHAQKSLLPKKWSPEILSTDMVLNVEHIKEIGNKLGKKVTFMAVENAIHDIFLSKKEVREKALTEMINWLKKTIK